MLIPTFGPIQRALILRLGPGQTISSFNLLWKLMIKQLVFADPKDLLSGLFLLYNFRVFEKRYGTRKFSVRIYINKFLQCIQCIQCMHSDFQILRSDLIPCFVLFFSHIFLPTY